MADAQCIVIDLTSANRERLERIIKNRKALTV